MLKYNGKVRLRDRKYAFEVYRPDTKEYKIIVVTLSQWCSSVHLLRLCLHGSYHSYMTDYNSVSCWSVVSRQ